MRKLDLEALGEPTELSSVSHVSDAQLEAILSAEDADEYSIQYDTLKSIVQELKDWRQDSNERELRIVELEARLELAQMQENINE